MYLDTSVVIALYAREADSERCEAIAATGDGFFSSELLVGEMASALLAKERGGLISRRLREEITEQFEAHVADGTVQLITLNGLLVREAVDVMTQIHPEAPLRTLDAIHLATFLSVDAGPLFTRDKRMIEAAKKLNLPLADA